MTHLRKIKTSLLLSGLIILCACNGNNQNVRQNREWKTQVVSKSDINTTNRYSASIQGRQDIEIRPQVSGTIISVNIKEGESVKKGQTLFVIDQAPYLATLNQAVANVKAAKSALATAKLNYTGKQRLFTEKVISENEMLISENEFHSAEAVLAQCEAAEMRARTDLSYTEIKSPVNGMAGIIPFRQGALVGPDISQPLTNVSDNSEMYVYFSISENQALAMMREWGSMEKTIENMDEIELMLGDGSVYDKKGQIESISGVVDRNTGSVALRAVFDNPDKLLLSGSSGNVLITTKNENVIVIPQSATSKIQDRYLVYKVIDGKAQSAQIIVANENNGKEYIVLSGLNEGDVIVADGVGVLREGMVITTSN